MKELRLLTDGLYHIIRLYKIKISFDVCSGKLTLFSQFLRKIWISELQIKIVKPSFEKNTDFDINGTEFRGSFY